MKKNPCDQMSENGLFAAENARSLFVIIGVISSPQNLGLRQFVHNFD